MGLDMYLEREYGLCSKDDLFKSDIDIYINNEKQPLCGKSIKIIDDVGYWWKANAIHNWFVENTQGGVDKCQHTWVTKEQLKELQKTCQEVLDDHTKAEELLPTCSGCFFGSEEYDEYYFKQLEYTVELIDQLRLDDDTIVCEYYYQSSW